MCSLRSTNHQVFYGGAGFHVAGCNLRIADVRELLHAAQVAVVGDDSPTITISRLATVGEVFVSLVTDHLRWQSSEMILRRLPPGDGRRSTMSSAAGAPSRAALALALALTLS